VEVLQHSLSTTLKRVLKLLVQQIDRCFDTMCYLPKLFCCLHSATLRCIKLFNPTYLLRGDTLNVFYSLLLVISIHLVLFQQYSMDIDNSLFNGYRQFFTLGKLYRN